MEEIWKDIEGYEKLYQVSNLGRVKSLKFGKERILKAIKGKDGYLRISFCKERKIKTFLVHRLVAFAFIPNPDNLPQVNHLDENKQNNISSNLEFCDAKYNINYGTHNKRQSESNTNHPSKSKKVLCVETGEIYPSTMQVERELGFPNVSISAVCTGKIKTYKGFHWRYID